MKSEKEVRFTNRILTWYENEGRHGLPWRQRDVSPFHILIAEFLLQQTRAEQVEGVFTQLVQKYRTPRDVVASESAEQDLKTLIEQIGLVKRAKYIRKSAEQIVEQHDGTVPDNYSELSALHGVGDYTAYSVLTHAHGANVGVVDTNVARILSRVFGLEYVDEPYTDEYWELAQRLVPTGRASDYNYALIDFGAEICTLDSPDCPTCPLNNICEFYAQNHSDGPNGE